MKIKQKHKRCVNCNQLSEVLSIKNLGDSTDVFLKCPDNHLSRINFNDRSNGVVQIEINQTELDLFMENKIHRYGVEFLREVMSQTV